MPCLIVIIAYLVGSIPTAYIAGRLLKGGDIRRIGDGNMGARNAYHELGHKTGIGIFFIDPRWSSGRVLNKLVAKLDIPF